jgi:hypothetical protein
LTDRLGSIVETFQAVMVSNQTPSSAEAESRTLQIPMHELAPAPASSFHRTARLLPALAGLLVASVVAFSSSSPPSHYTSWVSLISFALQRIFTIGLSCAFTVAALCAILSRHTDLDQHAVLVQTSRAAIWLVPLALFLHTNSGWTLVAVSAFAVLLTASLYPERHDLGAEDSLLSSLRPDDLPLFPRYGTQTSALAALAAQAGALIFFAGRPIPGAALVGSAVCLWAWRSIPDSCTDSLPSQSQSVPIALIAVLFTLAALVPYLRGAGGFGLGSSRKYDARSLSDGNAPRRPAAPEVLDESTTTASEGNSGIVLWPDRQVHTKLIAPAPLDLTSKPAFGRNTNPLVIPFHGVYWFFKAPDLRPPKTSRQAHASPEAVEIRSTDRRPLFIEAHDYLGSLIDLNCCSRVQVSIRNADRYPETVSLELILVDTSQPTHASESLGRVMVKSTRPWRIYEHPKAVNETLNFQIPPRSSLRHFDEISIFFRLDRSRADDAARIAIDHLVLIPRGL